MKCIESDEILKSFSRLDELLDIMVQSGCDLTPRVGLVDFASYTYTLRHLAIAKRHSIEWFFY